METEKKILFRYIKTGNVYMPQFKQPQLDNVWKHFTRETFKDNSLLGKMAYLICSLSNSGGWGAPIYYFRDSKKVYFLTEIEVMAFLGAAQSYYSSQAVEFTMDIETSKTQA